MPATIKHRNVFPFIPYNHEDYKLASRQQYLFDIYLLLYVQS